ncbi:MAG: BTAD domain-containing putative transcriptional regulator [Inquilinaceae bacterium]
MLARVALSRTGRAPRDTLAALLWEDSPEAQARTSLRQALAHARKALGSAAPALESAGDSVALDRTLVSVDVEDLHRLVNDSDRHGEAVDLLKGDLLDGLTVRGAALEAWLEDERRRIRPLELQALEGAVRGAMAVNELSRALDLARRALALEPLQERLHRSVMRILAALGEPTQAIRQFQDCRALLDRELGVRPEPETTALFDIIRAARTAAPRSLGRGNAEPTARLIAERTPPASALRQVTVLCGLSPAFDEPEDMADARARLRVAGDAAAAAHGGTVIDSDDTDLLIVFGLEDGHEDDTARALAAASVIADVEPETRIGCAAGRVLYELGPPARITGDARRRAAALAATAAPGAVGRDEVAIRAGLPDAATGTDPRRGLQIPADDATPSARRPQAPFVGRLFERRQLAAITDTVRDQGRGAIVLITGEPGIGKTRLAQEFALEIESRGGRTALAGFLGFGTSLPLSQRLARALTSWPCPSPDGEGAAAAAVRARLLETAMPPGGEALLTAMPRDRYLTLATEVVAGMLCPPGGGAALVIVEDAHWGGPGGLAFLVALAGQITAIPALLIVTERTAEARFGPLLRRRIPGAPLITLDLGPLPEADAARLAEAIGPRDPEFTRTAIARADGNALFLVRLLEAGPDLGGAVPPSVVSLMQEQSDRLPDLPKRVLRQAAIVGQSFGIADYAAVFGDADFGTLVAAGFLVPEEGRMVFAHALIHEAVYASMPRAERRRLHKMAADRFRALDPVGWADQALLAGADDAAAACAAAADAVLPRHQFDLGERYIEAGLAASGDDETRAHLLLSRGSLRRERGDLKPALQDYAESANLAVRPETRAQAWVRQAWIHRLRGDLDEADRCLDEAARIPEDRLTPDLVSEIDNQRGAQAFARGDVDGCERHHARAAAKAETPQYRSRALGGLGDAHYAAGRMLSARDSFSACVSLAREHGLGLVELNHAFMEAFCAYLADPGLEALARADAAVERAADAGNARSELLSRHVRAEILLPALDLDRGWTDLEVCDRLIVRLGAPAFAVEQSYIRATALDLRGDRAAALAEVRGTIAASAGPASGYIAAALQGLLAQFTDDADERTDALARGEAILAAGSISHAHLFFRQAAGEALLRAEDWDGALVQADRLQAYTAAEPLGWSDLTIRRLRLLARAGSGDTKPHDRDEAGRLISDLEAALLRHQIAAVRDAFPDA